MDIMGAIQTDADKQAFVSALYYESVLHDLRNLVVNKPPCPMATAVCDMLSQLESVTLMYSDAATKEKIARDFNDACRWAQKLCQQRLESNKITNAISADATADATTADPSPNTEALPHLFRLHPGAVETGHIDAKNGKTNKKDGEYGKHRRERVRMVKPRLCNFEL
ncbi:hypothetical protein N7517_003587 [Penicillium concentricum]|uniref:Uncharacterized protein n=1 Tax=Penicillium concentricum TaxID=293559 RepID=A0A9W9S3Z4_9EURO|nr:uncharacterized protein N7517_003587 [Penicillium concentricum]KAJ5371581.1 hypothetical protein N7517_003587 [Penicillium concentricum]